MRECFKKHRHAMIRWYVLRSKHRNEDFLLRQLYGREMEAYYPCICIKRKNLHTWKVKPYFPGYLFVHTDLECVGISGVQWIPGAIGLVSFGGEPAWIPDALLQGIRERVDQINNSGVEAWRNLKPGDDVAIHSGPFSGYHGIFSSYLSDQERVIIFLKLLRDQQVRVELRVGQVASMKHLQT